MALVVTRKASQSVCIGPDIEVAVTEVSHGRVRLAIKAPKSVKIYRKEIVLDLKMLESDVKENQCPPPS